jgi:energy-coupling factor transporter ATP-binding protein EcfA2
MSARNSGLFYWLAKWSTELRDMPTVFHELLNKKGDLFDFTIGNLIQPEALDGDPMAVTRALERHTVFDTPLMAMRGSPTSSVAGDDRVNLRNANSLDVRRQLPVAQIHPHGYGRVNLFIGENGVGKSNLYRALQLIQAAVRGRLAHRDCPRRRHGVCIVERQAPARRARAHQARGRIARRGPGAQFPLPGGGRIAATEAAAGFAFEPQVKEEELKVDAGRPVTVMKRAGPGIFVRNAAGRMEDYPEHALTSETAIALLGDAGHYPEIGTFRRAIDGWRFFHGFRTDRDSPLRSPCLAVTAPMLDEDGSNLAAVFATLFHTRQDTVDLDRAIADAFGGARLIVPQPQEFAEFSLVFPDFPLRQFRHANCRMDRCGFWRLPGRCSPTASRASSRSTSRKPACIPTCCRRLPT